MKKRYLMPIVTLGLASPLNAQVATWSNGSCISRDALQSVVSGLRPGDYRVNLQPLYGVEVDSKRDLIDITNIPNFPLNGRPIYDGVVFYANLVNDVGFERAVIDAMHKYALTRENAVKTVNAERETLYIGLKIMGIDFIKRVWIRDQVSSRQYYLTSNLLSPDGKAQVFCVGRIL